MFTYINTPKHTLAHKEKCTHSYTATNTLNLNFAHKHTKANKHNYIHKETYRHLRT